MLDTEIVRSAESWNTTLHSLPYAHILQTWEWGEFKRETTGWEPMRLYFRDQGRLTAAVSIGMRQVGPLRVMYAPKGPVFATNEPEHWHAVLDALKRIAKQQRAIWLKIDPDIVVGRGVPGEADEQPDESGVRFQASLSESGWRFSSDQVQFRNTVLLDLRHSEDQLMSAMSQNTRRKIRIAEREGVQIRQGSIADLPLLYQLYQITGERDAFLIRPFSYYQEAWKRFIEAGLAQPLIAERDGQALAHVILFHFGHTCWYFYGASSNEQRDVMPNYLLQWEAMRWAKAQGYSAYDMWGAPDHFVETDSLWGVYQFKRGFRGTVVRHVGAWDYAPSQIVYGGYTELMPRIRRMLRGR